MKTTMRAVLCIIRYVGLFLSDILHLIHSLVCRLCYPAMFLLVLGCNVITALWCAFCSDSYDMF